MISFLSQPWPWYLAGPLIGLMVPLLLFIGNKSFGISSSLRHVCAACVPSNLPFFSYNWRKEMWNLFFVFGILIGGFIASYLLGDLNSIAINPHLIDELKTYNITHYDGMLPKDIFNWPSLFTLKGFIMMVGGGFFIGFGARYAGGCTSGHSIMGISNLQWPSLVATICFMIGGFIMTNLILPYILSLS